MTRKTSCKMRVKHTKQCSDRLSIRSYVCIRQVVLGRGAPTSRAGPGPGGTPTHSHTRAERHVTGCGDIPKHGVRGGEGNIENGALDWERLPRTPPSGPNDTQRVLGLPVRGTRKRKKSAKCRGLSLHGHRLKKVVPIFD